MNECVVKNELLCLIETYFHQPNKLKSVFKDCKNKRSLLYVLKELVEYFDHWVECAVTAKKTIDGETDSFDIVEKDCKPVDCVWLKIDEIPSNWSGILTSEEIQKELCQAMLNCENDDNILDSDLYIDCLNGEFLDLVKDACLKKLADEFYDKHKLSVLDDEVREELIDYLRKKLKRIKVINNIIYDGNRKARINKTYY